MLENLMWMVLGAALFFCLQLFGGVKRRLEADKLINKLNGRKL